MTFQTYPTDHCEDPFSKINNTLKKIFVCLLQHLLQKSTKKTETICEKLRARGSGSKEVLEG